MVVRGYCQTLKQKQLHKAISLYNNDRPNVIIGNLTPNKLYNNQKINPQRLWKNYLKKRNTFENNENYPVNLLKELSVNLQTFLRRVIPTKSPHFVFASNFVPIPVYLIK